MINGRTTQYLYDGKDIVQEIENGVATVNYIRTLNIDEPLARIESSGTVRYYHADALGSIIALTDETGTEVTQYSYEPFGSVNISGEISDNPFQYTGRENDGTGLYYYRARYYDSKLQRFISEDPIRLEYLDINFNVYDKSIEKPYGGANLYLYVEDNPINLSDPLGLRILAPPGLKPYKCVNQCFAKCDREFEKDTCEKPLNWQKNIAKTASCDTMCVIRCWSVFPPDFANNE